MLLLDEPTNDLDVDTLRALEEALLGFAGCAVVISHDRWFLDRIATHILAFEGNSEVVWFEGNFKEYDADLRRRKGADADHAASRDVQEAGAQLLMRRSAFSLCSPAALRHPRFTSVDGAGHASLLPARGDLVPARRACRTDHRPGVRRDQPRRASRAGRRSHRPDETGVPLFGVERRRARSRAHRRWSTTPSFGHPGQTAERHSGGRLLGPAVRERLHAIRACRRPRGLAAHGPVGRTELEALARQPLRRAGDASHSTRARARRSGSSPTR